MNRSKGSQTKQQTASVELKIRDFFVFSLAEEREPLRLSPHRFYFTRPLKVELFSSSPAPNHSLLQKVS